MRYRTNSGLSDNTIFDVNVASNDLVWLSTNFGLNRFDGIEFEFYSKEQNELRSNFIQKSFEDYAGNIWLSTQYKKTNNKRHFLNVLNPEADAIYSVEDYLSETNMAMADSTIDLITQGTKGKDIWIVKNNGEIWKYDTQLKKIYDQVENIESFVVLQNENQNCLIINNNLLYFDKAWSIQKALALPNNIYDAFEKNGNIYLVDYTFSEKRGKSFSSFELNKILGIKVYKVDQVGTITTLHDEPVKGGKITESRNQLFWCTGKEIYYFNIDSFEKGALIWSSNRDIVLDFEQLDETFFVIGTNDGVVLQNIEEKKFKSVLKGNSTRQIFPLDNGKHIFFSYGADEDPELGNLKEALDNQEDLIVTGLSAYKAKDACYWFGRHNSNVKRICPEDGAGTSFLYPFEGNTGLDAHLIYQDRKSTRTWIGTNAGLSIIDEQKNTHSIYQKANGFDKIKTTFVNAFYENEKGLWVCTYDGIFLIDVEKGVQDYFSASTGHIPFSNVFHIHEDEKGVFWLATKGGGLVEWKPFTKEYRTYNTSKGLSNNVVYAVYEDEIGDFWLPSNYGINRFDKETKEVLNVYLKEDGLPEDEFNFLSHSQSKDGELYFGGINGVVSFYPRDFAFKRKNAAIRIDQINVVSSDGELIDKTKEYKENNQVYLKSDERSFVLDFHLQEINISQPRMYGYRFKGIEKSWNYTKEGYVRISSVPYGESELELKGMSASGQWSDKVALVLVVAQQPIYTKLWFILSMFLLVFLIGFLYYRWKIYWVEKDKERLEEEVMRRTAMVHDQKVQLERQNKALESLNSTKDRFFTIIAHDLRKPILAFRGIASKIDYLVSKEQFSRLKKLNASIEESSYSLTNLLDNLLNWAQSQEGSMPYEPANVDVQQIVDELIVIYHQLANNKGINLETAIDPACIVFADPRAVASIIRNLLDNAIKFTEPKGNISLTSTNKQDGVYIVVEDNGVGIEKSRIPTLFDFDHEKTTVDTSGERGPGLGLVLVKDLVLMNEGSVEIKPKLDGGTIVRIKLPAKKD